jgi:hypothetical protein
MLVVADFFLDPTPDRITHWPDGWRPSYPKTENVEKAGVALKPMSNSHIAYVYYQHRGSFHDFTRTGKRLAEADYPFPAAE